MEVGATEAKEVVPATNVSPVVPEKMMLLYG
jgi:hypothetical protein